ncbi:hypothetical protein Tco_1049049 [Tanacetum coccineum]
MIETLLKIMRGRKGRKRRKTAGESSSKKDKYPANSSNYETFYNELVDANKDPEEFELQEGSTIMFDKKMKGFLKKDKITRANLKRPAFELLKNWFINSVKLEYNLEQCYLAMADTIDWEIRKETNIILI